MLFVPLVLSFFRPLHSRANSLEHASYQTLHTLGFFNRSRNSKSLPVEESNTAFKWSVLREVVLRMRSERRGCLAVEVVDGVVLVFVAVRWRLRC